MTRKYNQGVADANHKRTKHGGAVGRREGRQSRLYAQWLSMKQRCFNPNSTHYHRYGGRGVTMCQEWADSFDAFRTYIGDPPASGMTLERIDNDKGYEPNNVRWATRKEQANNRATNVTLTWEGKTMTLKQWAEYLGWKYGMLASRWKKGLRGADLFAPRKADERNLPVEYEGRSMTLTEWAKETGVSYVTLHWRHKHGKPLL